MTHIANRGQVSCLWAPHVLPSGSINILSNSDNGRHTFAFKQCDMSQGEQQAISLCFISSAGKLWRVTGLIQWYTLLCLWAKTPNCWSSRKVRSSLQVWSGDLAGFWKRSQATAKWGADYFHLPISTLREWVYHYFIGSTPTNYFTTFKQAA